MRFGCVAQRKRPVQNRSDSALANLLQTHVEGHRMAGGRLQKLGSGDLDSGPSKGPGVVVPAIVTIATANPSGLAVGGAAKAAGEVTGSSTIEGAGKRTAKKIAEELRPKFQEQGWIE